MNLENIRSHIKHHLAIHLRTVCPIHPFSEVYNYVLFPPGKLFRPLLIWAIWQDFTSQKISSWTSSSPHAFFMSAIEIHHTYTLIHDDLPCMDNDDLRRGRPTAHKQFNEWKALLAGDGLLNASYQLLSHASSPSTLQIIKMMGGLLGPKGLIQGQVIDLLEEANSSYEKLIQMHKLKTSRLIQTCLLGSYLLINPKQRQKLHIKRYSNYRIILDLYKLGHYLGITFQLLDDLSELAQQNIETHEQNINPWPRYFFESLNTVTQCFEKIIFITDRYNLTTLKKMLMEYIEKMNQLFQQEATLINQNGKRINTAFDLLPILSQLNLINHSRNV